MDVRASVQLARGFSSHLNFLGNLGIFSAMLTGKPFPPSVVVTDRNIQGVTQPRDAVLILMLGNESVPHYWLREKMPTAFLGKSPPSVERNGVAELL
jgi:hypothetical protein